MDRDPVDYQDAIRFLYSLVDYSLIPNLDFSTEKFNLQRMVKLITLMGNPQKVYPVIHVAGTKGKGSTAAILTSILQSAGYRVGLFTSPFLFDFCEQIQINRVSIPQRELVRQLGLLKPLLEKVQGITTFEAVTAICFQYFKEHQVDIAIIEAGLGGRTDATNVLDPLFSVITSISYDHVKVLGGTIELIAQEKAGIIKQGQPVIVAPQIYPEAKKIIMKMAAMKDSEVILVDEEIEFKSVSYSIEGQTASIKITNDISGWSGQYWLSLLGAHQIENAATAIMTANRMTGFGFSVSRENLRSGLREVIWPCRFEVINRDPLIIVDGAHNVDSIKKLKQTIKDYLPGYKIILIFGVSLDKDIAGMFKELLPEIEWIIFSKSSHPRAAEPVKLVELVKSDSVSCEITENLSEAVEMAKNKADQRTAIIVTGSIFIAAAAREVILNQ